MRVLAALKADPAVAALVGGRVFDQAPEGAEHPHLVIGQCESRPVAADGGGVGGRGGPGDPGSVSLPPPPGRSRGLPSPAGGGRNDRHDPPALNFITLIASKFCTPPPTRLVV